MNRAQILQRRIRWLTWFFIIGLVLSGVTAIPLPTELDWLVKLSGARQLIESPGSTNSPEWVMWLMRVQDTLHQVDAHYPILFYGTDWLAFGHFMIALAFVGILRDPVRNLWLFNFGLMACVLIIPYAFGFGAVRGIPFWWRLIDCSFGIFGFIPLWFCRRWAKELEFLTEKTRALTEKR